VWHINIINMWQQVTLNFLSISLPKIFHNDKPWRPCQRVLGECILKQHSWLKITTKRFLEPYIRSDQKCLYLEYFLNNKQVCKTSLNFTINHFSMVDHLKLTTSLSICGAINFCVIKFTASVASDKTFSFVNVSSSVSTPADYISASSLVKLPKIWVLIRISAS